jgi:hypothetical protein
LPTHTNYLQSQITNRRYWGVTLLAHPHVPIIVDSWQIAMIRLT